MANGAASRDWATPQAFALGPPEDWRPPLTPTVQVCLETGFPVCIAWGAERLQVYNEAFARFCGDKHPRALGQDMRVCWESAWEVLGPHFERALRGERTYTEDGRLYLNRGGVLQETFATFSFSPVWEPETATVLGVMLTILETTGRALVERRSKCLCDLISAGIGATGAREALTSAVHVLAEASQDVPFALVYGIAPGGHEAELVARTPAAPESYSPAHLRSQGAATQRGGWPLADVVATQRSQVVEDLALRFGPLEHFPQPAVPTRAHVLPITLPGGSEPYAVLVAAQSPHVTPDEEYSAFLQRVAEAISFSVASAQAHEAERRRADQLSALDRAKTTFFSNVSHELRTPLTLIAGPLEDELAEAEQPLPELRRERLATAQRNTLRLLKLVNSLLDFSRLEAGRTLARYRPTPLGTLTSELASLFRSALERAGLTLLVEVDPLPEPVFVDREMWEKIVLNLMSNAFKHTFVGGVSVRLRSTGAAAELIVADTGIGIAQQELPLLFERFHRVPEAESRTHEGTGIGLALVRELARLHGGDVSVESEEGAGTTFSVKVPFGNAHLPPEHVDLDPSAKPAGVDVAAYVQEALQWSPDPRPQEVGANAETPAKSGKVLLADDNADMRAYISGLLEGAYHVVAVPDGQAALEAVRTFQPDLVLADVMMPRLGGAELLRHLRGDDHTRQLPVILLSARASAEEAIQGIEAGADDYLTKPFTGRELLARVRTHVELSRARRDHAAHLEEANQELEAFSYSVSHDLRTPLRAIDGFSKAILDHKSTQLDEEGKEYLARVRRAAVRMGELIDELLNLSRVSRSPLQRRRVSLTELSERVVKNLRELQPGRGIQFQAQVGVTAYADPRLLQIVFENLLDNSWKFTRLRTDARVEVGQLPGSEPAVYFVRDNGAGFDPSYSQRLFQPFQRLHLERDYPGTGIGLAIVHRIIRRHGGQIWAEGRERQGATFFFTLPETP
jgi:signal transduction histidine kinase